MGPPQSLRQAFVAAAEAVGIDSIKRLLDAKFIQHPLGVNHDTVLAIQVG